MENKFISGILMLVIVLGLGSTLGVVSYNYELSKCSSLTSGESSYDFDHKIELDAHFNSNCFYYHNHPFALAGKIVGNTIIIFLITILITGFVILIREMNDSYY